MSCCQWNYPLISSISLFYSYQNGLTVLINAGGNNESDVIRYLIEAGADVNQKDGVSIRIPYTAMCECMFCLSIIQSYCITCEYNHSIILC